MSRPPPPRLACIGATSASRCLQVARGIATRKRGKNGNYIGLWGKMPDLMLAKVCRSAGVAQSFPRRNKRAVYRRMRWHWPMSPLRPAQTPQSKPRRAAFLVRIHALIDEAQAMGGIAER